MTRKRLLLSVFLLALVASFTAGCDFFRGITGPSGIGSPARNVRYYGYYFIEDPAKNQSYVHEVVDFANIVNMRYDNGANNSWDYAAASRVKTTGVKVMLQLPLGPDSSQTLFVDSTARRDYLNKVKQDMVNTNFMSSLAYIALSEEWYTLISQGHYDEWPIFQGKSREEKFAIAKQYLEQIIDDAHRIFPGIPTVIVDNVMPHFPPPNNVDVIGVDAYYIPTSPECDPEQKALFDSQVLPYYDAARSYGKPLMMVAPSFIGGPWRMLSQCQMDWYYELAASGNYNLTSFLWFVYADVNGFRGVRNFPDLVSYQREIGRRFLGN